MSATDQLTEVAADLLEAANLPWKNAPREILQPDWNGVGRVHDWRNHIPSALRERWPELSPDARVAAYILAKDAAEAEEWD